MKTTSRLHRQTDRSVQSDKRGNLPQRKTFSLPHEYDCANHQSEKYQNEEKSQYSAAIHP
jgi:hypothetical protein